VLIAIYALFALAASARAAVQIATKFGNAPVAYMLSAFAAVIYILATVTLAVGSPTARRIAVISCSVELAGVLAVGTWSLADPATFPDATVWSGYGSGYGFVPLVLPVLGLLWLRRWTGRGRTRRADVTPAGDAGEAAGSGVHHGEDSGPGTENVAAADRTRPGTARGWDRPETRQAPPQRLSTFPQPAHPQFCRALSSVFTQILH
jgi:hypothetical protein